MVALVENENPAKKFEWQDVKKSCSEDSCHYSGKAVVLEDGMDPRELEPNQIREALTIIEPIVDLNWLVSADKELKKGTVFFFMILTEAPASPDKTWARALVQPVNLLIHQVGLLEDLIGAVEGVSKVPPHVRGSLTDIKQILKELMEKIRSELS